MIRMSKGKTAILRKLRQFMVDPKEPIRSYIIPSGGAHVSEYIAARDERRARVSGFTGSAGTVIVTENQALLCTDGRSYVHASSEIDSNWMLLRMGIPDAPTQSNQVNENLPSECRVGVDPFLYSRTQMSHDLRTGGKILTAVRSNLVDLLWPDRLSRPLEKIKVFNLNFAGKSSANQLNDIRQEMSTAARLAETEQTSKPEQGDKKPNLDGKPNADQLQRIADRLEKTLPNIFSKRHDFSMYNQNVILIDNIRGKTYQGLPSYIQQVAWLKLAGHYKYAVVSLEIVNMSQVPNEGRVTVQWRIKGLSGLGVMVKFWKYRLWKWKDMMTQKSMWHEGISHFDVGPDGLISRHIIDKVIEDREQISNTQKIRLAPI